MTLLDNLRAAERARDAFWRRYPSTASRKLAWRASVVRHAFHVLPGESVLELGAGRGLWTEHLVRAFRGENPVTAVRLDEVDDLDKLVASGPYDYVVGLLPVSAEVLELIHALLKPGGQFILFDGRRRRYPLMQLASECGFVEVQVVPYDIVPARAPRALLDAGYVLEHLPAVKELCGTRLVWARKPPVPESRPPVDLAVHDGLAGAVSVVIPCHNEEMNVGRLIDALLTHYDRYVAEIVVVDDNSTDATAAVAEARAAVDPRVKVVRRSPPPGVGRGLRDGYAAATGRYVLSLDCDFFPLAPEFRDLFDAVAAGHDGAMGSRFSRDSILLNYPPFKILGNRTFHLLVRLVLRRPVRDVSNNFKLLRRDIVAGLRIDQDGFAANAETGLRPLLAGYDIAEVPVSWVGRTAAMGASSFKTARVAPGYVQVFLDVLRGRRSLSPPPSSPPEPAARPPARPGSGRASA